MSESNENNPYQTPEAELVSPRQSESGVEPHYVGAQAQPAGRGWDWIKQALQLVRLNMLAWIVATIIYFGLTILVQLIPGIGYFASYFLGPILLGGFMLGAHQAATGGNFEIAHMFAGFSDHFKPLFIVGLLYFASAVLALLIVGAVSFLMFGGFEGLEAFFDPESAKNFVTGNLLGFYLLILIMMGLMLPVVMAVWFAPALIVLHRKAPVEAMMLSLGGCLRNMLPFLLYGLAMMGLAILASIPFALGWLLLAPVITASAYTSMRDIYTNQPYEHASSTKMG